MKKTDALQMLTLNVTVTMTLMVLGSCKHRTLELLAMGDNTFSSGFNPFRVVLAVLAAKS